MMEDLLTLISKDSQLKRVAGTNGGEYAGSCPFCGGRDRFRAWPNSEPPRFWCRQCGKNGDAIAYAVMRGDLTPEEAGRLRHGNPYTAITAIARPPAVKPPEPKTPDDDWQTRAMAMAINCAAMLWEPEGAKALAWLRARGLQDEILKAHLVGYQGKKEGKGRDGFWYAALYGFRVHHGITVPHFCEASNVLSGIKIRLSTNKPDNYRSVAGSRPSLYLADTLIGHDVAMLVEGELDALLLCQEVGDLVGTVALGSASNRVGAIDAGLPFLLAVKRLLVATDTDEAGEKAAAVIIGRTKRARRLKVPEGKDPGDYWKSGGDLRAWVVGALGDLDLPHEKGDPVAAWAVQHLGAVASGQPANGGARRVDLLALGLGTDEIGAGERVTA